MVRNTLLCLLSEGPFGQTFHFNANVLFLKISMSIDIRYETFVENENHLQNLEYVGITNNTFKTKIDENLKYNFWVFTSTLNRKLKVFPNGLQGARMSPCASKMCFSRTSL